MKNLKLIGLWIILYINLLFMIVPVIYWLISNKNYLVDILDKIDKINKV